MKVEDFDLFVKMLYQKSGLVLTKEKAYLLESRLMPIARRWNMADLGDLATALRQKNDANLIADIVDAMTTNESSFFRDQKPFDQFRQLVLPKYLAARTSTKRLRIWSAACSNGQEPYSLAMILDEEKAKLAGWQIEIVATDLCRDVLEKAKQGIYTQFEVQRGLPITMLVKYFTQMGDKWQISKEMRDKIKYQSFNLLEDMRPLGQFDIIFCRNVLIYFDQQTKGKILENMARQMPGDGTLYLGGAETVLGITQVFKPMDGQRGLYVMGGAAPPSVAQTTAAAR
jgi:chemotaxis protein methyltransferase CheR